MTLLLAAFVLAVPLTQLQQDFDQGLIDRLKQTKPGDASRPDLIEKVSGSGHPAAVKYMIEALQNPTAAKDLKEAAYENLARVGGEAGADAVLEARQKRFRLPPLKQRVTFEGWSETGEVWRKPKLFERYVDARGRMWGLLNHSALGHSHDLWLAEFFENRWINPIFTGLKAPADSDQDLPSQIPALLANDIAKDSDSDGLSDLAEVRIATDPHNPDTDGDGDRDEIDPVPHVRPRPLISEAEKVLAAAYEYRYHFTTNAVPIAIFPQEQLIPFEIVGWKGPVVWLNEAGRRMYRQMATPHEITPQISFGVYDIEPGQAWSDKAIKWSNNGTEATITIATAFGLMGADWVTYRLKKHKADWVVVEMLEYIVT